MDTPSKQIQGTKLLLDWRLFSLTNWELLTELSLPIQPTNTTPPKTQTAGMKILLNSSKHVPYNPATLTNESPYKTTPMLTSETPIHHICKMLYKTLDSPPGTSILKVFDTFIPTYADFDGKTIYYESILLIQEYRDFVKSLHPPDKQQRHLEPIDQILNTLHECSATTNTQTLKKMLKTAHIDRLLSQVELLQGSFTQTPTIDFDDAPLNDIKTDITTLTLKIHYSSEIDPNLKIFLLISLRKIHDALHRIPVFGPQLLSKYLQETLGANFLHYDQLTHSTDPNVKQYNHLILTTWEWAKTINIFIQISEHGLKLLDHLEDLS